ncbi:uncharacterized protein LOC113331017 [Papaver somniferum]|uniref:uncharacterized protein LOC113331017 n=1 Tax=Papaver somniferum TaxID=3469 RepID=UPI000E702C55|nr:uncharacterized protein LOC113331017 [Papaver somniferum]
MSEKFVHDVLNHGEHFSAFRVNTLITADELKHFYCKQWRSLSPLSIRFSYMDTNQVVFIQGDIQLQSLVALVIQMNNEDFYLNVDVIPKHTGCSTSSRYLSRSNSGCSSSSGASTSNSCVSESPKLVRMVDHDADKAKPLIIDEWRYVFDNIGREFVGGVKAVRISVDQYKMCTGYKILILKNEKTRFTAKCEEDGCDFFYGCGVGLKLKSPVVTTKGKEAVFEDQYGDDEKSYSDLNWYVKAIEQTNPDSFVKLEADEETGRFKRIFICFGACKHSYRYFRPMIYLDATFFIGSFRRTLMAATCVNGNDGFYPYAFAIVLSENKDNCCFFYHIKCNLPIGKGDANYNAVIDLFYKVAYSYTSANFEEALRGMHAIGCGNVANYLRTIPKEKWANAFFPVCRYAAHSSSIAESFNNWILEFKKLPDFALLDAIRLKVMHMNSKRSVEGLENFNTRLTPVYEDLLNENINVGRTWIVVESMERLYEVRSPRTHSVDLLDRTCTCHRWQVNGFPCAHACAAIQSTREDIYSFVEPYFTTEWYNRTYQDIIFPIPNYDKPQYYDPSDRIIVPIPVPPPGRRREQRFKKAWEKQNRPMMCKKCFTLGHHNRATCPMP